MDLHLQKSLDELEKVLNEADPDEFLADFLEFQKQSEGGVTVDELIATFTLSV
jgi:hypothetical protein